MVIMSAYKPDMHVHAEIGLFGTASSMKATEAAWAAAGNNLKPRGFTAVRGVHLDIPRKDWVDTRLAESKSAAIPIGNGWPFQLRDGSMVQAPDGYRPLQKRELPRKPDIAWNYYSKVWEPIDFGAVQKYGPRCFKDRAHGIVRKKK